MSSCETLATQPLMGASGKVIFSQESSEPAYQAIILNTGSTFKQYRQGLSFYNAFHATCPLISAFLEEKVKKKKDMSSL